MRAAALATLVSVALVVADNLRPIIGILTLPAEYPSQPNARSYFPASYVKFIESAGARVVPIFFDAPVEENAALISKLNGALFTGGGAEFFTKEGKLTPFATTAQLIFNESVNAYANGETWPVWGTCLGFELINVLAAGPSGSVLTSGWDSENYTTSVQWTAAASSSRLWGSVPNIRASFAAPNEIALNAHQSGVAPTAFNANGPLSTNFNILATSEDRAGKTFVATIEGKKWPIYATQWHPEKIAFEWDPAQASNHSYVSVVSNQYTAYFFDQQARQNGRSFPSEGAADAAVIWNYNPVFAYPAVSSEFDQLYFFPPVAAATYAAEQRTSLRGALSE